MASDTGARYRELIEASFDLVWSIDLSGRITFINGATRVVFGREPEEMIGQLFSEFVSIEDRARTITAFASVVRDAVDGVNLENAVHGKDGRLVPLLTNVRMLRDAGGIVTGIAGISRDITALKEAASELQRQAEEQRQLAEQLDVQRARLAEAQELAKLGSWDLDLLTNTLTWTDENYRIFEIDKSAFGASYEAFLERVHPDDRALVNRTYTESVTNRVAYAIDHRIQLPSGQVKIVHERCQTFYDQESGRALRSVGTCQDVTESRLAEARCTNHARLCAAFSTASPSASSGRIVTRSTSDATGRSRRTWALRIRMMSSARRTTTRRGRHPPSSIEAGTAL